MEDLDLCIKDAKDDVSFVGAGVFIVCLLQCSIYLYCNLVFSFAGTKPEIF